MAVEHPSARATDRGRIALAALFLYVIAAAMLLTLGDDAEEPTAVPPDAVPSDAVPSDAVPSDAVPSDSVPSSGEPSDTEAVAAAEATTHLIANGDEWRNAVANAEPGDVLRLTATIREPLIYEGGDDGGAPDGASGTAAAPITITADPGVWIDAGGFETRGWAGLNIRYVSHVHAVGIQVRNAQYGIRCLQCTGTAEAPVRIVNNTTTETGYVGINVAGHLETHAPSSHVLIEGNTISNTGRLVARFGEGIYLGHGGKEWVDETTNVVVRNNEISHTSAEGIDIKPGTREILVEGNRLHHIAPIDGGAISAHYVNGAANPKPNELDRVTIRNNRIWNHNLNGAPGASDAAVWIGHGGVELADNLVWGFRLHPNARSVRVQAKADFGPYPVRITNNVFWTERGWVAEGSHGPTAIVEASGNIGPDSRGIEQVVTIDAFTGPVPPLGQGGDANAGNGPGSGLTLAGGQPSPPPPPPAQPAQPAQPVPPPPAETPVAETPPAAPPSADEPPMTDPGAGEPSDQNPDAQQPLADEPSPVTAPAPLPTTASAVSSTSQAPLADPTPSLPAGGAPATNGSTTVPAVAPPSSTGVNTAQTGSSAVDNVTSDTASPTPAAAAKTASSTTVASSGSSSGPVERPLFAGLGDGGPAASDGAAGSTDPDASRILAFVDQGRPEATPSGVQPSTGDDSFAAALPLPGNPSTGPTAADDHAWSGPAQRAVVIYIITVGALALAGPGLQRRWLNRR